VAVRLEAGVKSRCTSDVGGHSRVRSAAPERRAKSAKGNSTCDAFGQSLEPETLLEVVSGISRCSAYRSRHPRIATSDKLWTRMEQCWFAFMNGLRTTTRR
jgi:hypothetical protein